MHRTAPHIRTASGVDSYRTNDDGSITAVLDDGEEVRRSACSSPTWLPGAPTWLAEQLATLQELGHSIGTGLGL